MSDIKLIYTSLGFSNVITYIQSGNVIFDSDEIPSYIETKMEAEIKNIYGFDVPVMVRSSLEIMTIITNNIFVEDENYDIERLNYTFLKIFPDQSQVKHILQYNFEPDKFNISGSGIYGYCSGKFSDTKYLLFDI